MDQATEIEQLRALSRRTACNSTEIIAALQLQGTACRRILQHTEQLWFFQLARCKPNWQEAMSSVERKCGTTVQAAFAARRIKMIKHNMSGTTTAIQKYE